MEDTMKKILFFAVLIAFILTVGLHGWLPAAYAQDAKSLNAQKVKSLLDASGFEYRKTNSPTVWTVLRTGKNLPEIKVVIAVSDTDIVIFVTAIAKASLDVTTASMYQLLKFNHTLDRVKVGFDKDDDVSVRIDIDIRLMDVAELKADVEQVIKASDAIYGAMKPYMKL
jgi:hypothetical protein